MNDAPDYRPPAQRFAQDMASALNPYTLSGVCVRPSGDIRMKGAYNIDAVVGGVKFTLTIREGYQR